MSAQPEPLPPAPRPTTGPDADVPRPAADGAAPAVTPVDADASCCDASDTPGPGVPAAGRGDLHKLPRRFGDYELLEEIARGGMGVVYKARQLKAGGRKVALKMILGGANASADALERFQREASLVAGFSHPNIVPVYEVGEAAGQPFYSMSLVEGGSLHERLQTQGPLDPRSAARLVRQVAEAVQHAHDQDVIHRDIKPHNILLQPSEQRTRATCTGKPLAVPRTGAADPAACEQPRLADFGLARTRQGGHSVTGEQLGTPSYMAPEQARGLVHAVDARTDVYGLGAVLYCALTGRPPFQSASPVETMRQVLEQEPAPPRRLNPALPRDLETICLKCLNKVPAKRYASARDLADDLRCFLQHEPIEARPTPAWERGVKWVRRRPTAAALLGVAVLILAALVGSGLWHQRQMRQTRQATRAADLVRALASAQTPEVPRLIDEIEACRAWADPLLRQELTVAPVDCKRRLHASLALLPVDPGQVPALRQRLLAAQPDEVEVLCAALRPHRGRLTRALWQVLEDADTEAPRRFRAACALAAYDPANPRWAEAGPSVAAHLVQENPLVLGQWAHALRPLRHRLADPLAVLFRDDRQTDAERIVAADLLADFAADDLPLLVSLLLDAMPRQFALLWPRLAARPGQTLDLLTAELERTPAAGTSAAARETLARRQAQAAVALVRLGRPEPVWRHLRHSPDPRLRTYLLHAFQPLGVDPRVLVQSLSEESDLSARRALLLALGEYPASKLPPADRKKLVGQLLEDYRNHPDPGLHAAVDWLLRRWGREAECRRIDRELAGQPRGRRRWYVSRMGFTLAVVPGPVTFRMGAAESEAEHQGDERPHTCRIPRSFALATCEVTAGQFERFARATGTSHRLPGNHSGAADAPVISVSWLDAARYCRWLSEQEGIPEDQMCYPPCGEIKEGAELPRDYLSRTGYRLPTEAEWEYGCRAGATTARAYGASETMLAQYAWYIRNSGDHTWPVGRLKPNDLGLFDTYGNAWEWCQNQLRPYPTGAEHEDREDSSRISLRDRVMRGGAFGSHASNIRSARRYPFQVTYLSVGLRIARTVPAAGR